MRLEKLLIIIFVLSLILFHFIVTIEHL